MTVTATAQYRQAVKHLSGLPANKQILALQYHLLCALHRESEIQERARDLESEIMRRRRRERELLPEVDFVVAALSQSRPPHVARLAKLANESPWTEWEQDTVQTARREHEEYTQELRVALHDAETRQELLDTLCQTLVTEGDPTPADESPSAPEIDETAEQAVS